MEVILEIREVVKTYAGTTALAVKRLGFGAGRIAVVCGPNGAGKSTLLRILALLDHPDRGEIFFRGHRLTDRGDWFAARKRVTMVDQHPYAFFGTVYDNVAYGLKLRGRPAENVRRRVAEALAAMGLAGFERRRARTLSGGEVQRMALARAIVCDPAVLILDEPTAHVDSAAANRVENFILNLRREKNLAIVLATHDHDQACRLSDAVLWMHQGRLNPNASRVVAGTLGRREGKLHIFVAQNLIVSQDRGFVTGLELAGTEAVVRCGPALPAFKIALDNFYQAAPRLGETAVVERPS